MRKHRKTLLGIVLILLFLIALFFQCRTTPEDDFAAGKKAYMEKGYQAAYDYFKKAVDKEPGNAQYLYNLGLALNKLNRYQEAYTCLEKAELLDPDIDFTGGREQFAAKVAELRKKLGIAEVGDYEGVKVKEKKPAREAEKKPVQEAGKKPVKEAGKKRAQEAEKQPVKEAGKKSLPTNPKDLFAQGKWAYKNKDFQEAYVFFKEILKYNKSSAKYYYHLGLAARKLKRFKEAYDCFLEAKELDPSIRFARIRSDFEGIVKELGRILGVKEQKKATISDFEVGKAAFIDKDYSWAGLIFEKLVKADPQVAEYHYFLGLVYSKTDQYQKALEQFIRAGELDPGITFTTDRRGFEKKVATLRQIIQKLAEPLPEKPSPFKKYWWLSIPVAFMILLGFRKSRNR